MFKIELAQHTIQINNKYEYVHALCKDYLTEKNPEYTIELSDSEIAAENKDNAGYSPGYLEGLGVYRKICEALSEQDIILFHSSAIQMDNKAILFTAPSGTGKSTHSRLWKKRFGDKVSYINDDKPLLKCTDDGVVVYGSPWAGKDSLQNNTSAPVAAVVALYRSEENRISPLSREDGFATLLNQTYRINELQKMTRLLKNINRLSCVPLFTLECKISLEAAELVYNTLKGRGIL